MAPGLLISPLAGALLDRLGAAKAIVIDMAASALLLLALGLADVAGSVTEPLLLTLVTLYSLTSPLGTAGIRVLIPRLVPKDALDLANALDTSSYALINVAGPAVAGLLFGFAGSQGDFAGDRASLCGSGRQSRAPHTPHVQWPRRIDWAFDRRRRGRRDLLRAAHVSPWSRHLLCLVPGELGHSRGRHSRGG